MKAALALIATGTLTLLLGCPLVLALDPSLDVSQYAHTAWTARDGFSLGNIYAMAQTHDGYLWLGGEFGLFRFDGVRSVPWQPPAGQQLPEKNINSLLVTRDGTLWIGTFAGLATWSGNKLTWRQELGKRQFVASLFEERDGTVWVGTLDTPTGRLCAMRSGNVQCYGEDGAFGRAVWALYEDSSGTLWAAAESGLWRMKPGPPRRYPTSTELIALNKTDDGRLLIALHDAGLMQLAGDKVEPYPVPGAINRSRVLRDREVDSNRVLRDRDGGLWIGTVERGLIHMHHGRTDVFTRADGLSGDVILSLFEDREGNVWVASTGGLDRFRELPVSTVSVKQGLFSDAATSVLAATDGSIWVGSLGGLTRWQNGQTTIFTKVDGVTDDAPQSLFQDYRGRIWVFTRRGLAYFKGGRFLPVNAVPGGKVHSITGDNAGNLWLSEDRSLLHVLGGRLVEQFDWSQLGRHQSAGILLSDREGGVWLGFWWERGVSHFKDRRLRASYTAANGLGEGGVQDLQLDQDGALWAATQTGGLSRIKDGRIVTLTSRNGLPCDTINWTIEDNDGSFWLYAACGLVRITRNELEAWIADPTRRIKTTVWDAADGVRLRSSTASEYGPRVAKSTDGKLWFVTGEGVQVVDPHHLVVNELPPPVRIEQSIANHEIYWRNLPGTAVSKVRLPALIRDLQIEYTALSLVAPEKVHFKYKLEGQDQDWREVVNDRQVQYSNLAPGNYRFRVIACNNSGVWNEEGDVLDFSIAPAYYQTREFLGMCLLVIVVAGIGAYRWRIRQVREREKQLEYQVEQRTGELKEEIEERKHAEAALSEARDQLEDRVRQRTAELEADVAQRKRVEAELRRSEDKFAKAFHSSPTGMTISSLETGRMIDVNDSFLKLFGFQFEEAIGRTSAELQLWEDAEQRERVVRMLREHISVRNLETRFRTKTGKTFDSLFSGEIVNLGGEECLLAVALDITEQKRLEDQLRQAQKMEAVGKLAGGVAHDFNNLLTVIRGYSRWTLDAPQHQDSSQSLERIDEAAERAAALTTQLLAFSRRQVLQPKVFNLNALVHNLDKMLQRLIGEDVEMVTVPAPDLGTVKADPGQIEQVIMNLAVNARDAMPKGGKLTLETANVDLDGTYAREHVGVVPGRYVMLAVSDTGVGIDAATQTRIFEPFFTTKEMGKGTGLGLSTVYGIVKQSGGNVWVYSEPGRGTTFKVYLPRVDAPAAAITGKQPPVGSIRGTETILLVEDDQGVRELARVVLAACGYSVLVADTALTVISMCERHAGPIHLLLTDVVMPRVGGREVAEQVTAHKPGIKVLYMSGYTTNAIVHHGALDSGTFFLQKPFTPHSLASKVREVLDQPRTA